MSVLRGQEYRKEFKIFGDNGVLCRPYIDVFKKEKYYIVGIYPCGNIEREGIKETTDDYQVTVCGEYWIEYNPNNNTVKGRIRGKKRKPVIMSFEKFKKLI